MAVLAEDVADQTDMALGDELFAIKGDNAGGFLTAMLQRVQTERGQGASVFVAKDAKNAALLVQFIVEGCGHCAGVPLPPLLPSKVSSAPGESAPAVLPPRCFRPVTRCYRWQKRRAGEFA
jgi:hypothetical protein